MSFTVFLGNLPTWVAKDDIKSWLASENLVFDDIKVIRNPETQESKGFAFIETPNEEEMKSIIRRFDRAPLEDRLLRANQAQPPKSAAGKPALKNATPADRSKRPFTTTTAGSNPAGSNPAGANPAQQMRRTGPSSNPTASNGGNSNRRSTNSQGRQSAFAEELAKAL
jgi:RNA recognition motif-containing protein